MSIRILIAGAGIGGLSAAIALRKQGFDVEVVEQAEAIGEVGAGIQLSANATRVIRWLGLEEALAEVGVSPDSQNGYDWETGARLYTRPMRDRAFARYGAQYYQVHRADLHDILASACDAESLTLGFAVDDVRQDGACVEVIARDGRSRKADILIGADGLKSVVRATALCQQDTPVYTGMTAFRGTFPAACVPEGLLARASNNWMGPHGHVVAYYLRRHELINVVGVMEVPEWTAENWSEEMSSSELLDTFAGWTPTVRTLLEAIERPFKWGLYDRQPASLWGHGRVTLLGDAAHPMVPFLAQGAGMAIEDAAILARCLGADRDDPVRGLRRYEDLRRDRTARVQTGRFGARGGNARNRPGKDRPPQRHVPIAPGGRGPAVRGV